MLLIDGMIDPISGAHMVSHFRELLPEASVTELKEIGHYPQVQAPREVLAAYLSFREEVAGHLAATDGQQGDTFSAAGRFRGGGRDAEARGT
jgi:hypothetical protein